MAPVVFRYAPALVDQIARQQRLRLVLLATVVIALLTVAWFLNPRHFAVMAVCALSAMLVGAHLVLARTERQTRRLVGTTVVYTGGELRWLDHEGRTLGEIDLERPWRAAYGTIACGSAVCRVEGASRSGSPSEIRFTTDIGGAAELCASVLKMDFPPSQEL